MKKTFLCAIMDYLKGIKKLVQNSIYKLNLNILK